MKPRQAATSLGDLKAGGKGSLARTLSAIEADPGNRVLTALLDDAYNNPLGRVIGLTGPPGVGKSTLTNVLIRRWRAAGHSVGVLAVDPSSRISGGALLGDRTRFDTDPADSGVFVRSLAARDRLGGLSELTVAAMVLMRAIYDRVLIETVGIGQSESDIVAVADTVVFCVQPGSGDSLQFMKSGIMEIPDIIAVTKSDMGRVAERARADVEGALSLGPANGGWRVPVLCVSANDDSGLEAFDQALDAHWDHLAAKGQLAPRRLRQAGEWVRDFVLYNYGTRGLRQIASASALNAGESPFARQREIAIMLDARLSGPPPIS
ncbi:MAG: methylmalonyl Co-A mutase-associated GTPase MeaB [Rhodobiaceae bacterium]|nr:methylmalonyl Co-A mutase-associated GTPase MeaB [Rhodobiaceae bacterium]